jgi:hypothetical protein
MIALSLGLCKPVFRCRPAIALCHRDRAGQAAGLAISAMPRKRQLAVKMAPVAMGHKRLSLMPDITPKHHPQRPSALRGIRSQIVRERVDPCSAADRPKTPPSTERGASPPVIVPALIVLNPEARKGPICACECWV